MMVLSFTFNLCVLLYVINRDEMPEFKLPWLILIFLVPILGAFIFVLFNGNEQPKKLKRVFDSANEKLMPYQKQTNAIEILQSQNTDAYLQANFIHGAANMPCQSSTKVTYYNVGEGFHAALLEALSKAERFIFMEYFIIEKGIMWDSIHDILVLKAKQCDFSIFIFHHHFFFTIFCWIVVYKSKCCWFGPPKTKYSKRRIPLLPSVEVVFDRQAQLVAEMR